MRGDPADFDSQHHLSKVSEHDADDEPPLQCIITNSNEQEDSYASADEAMADAKCTCSKQSSNDIIDLS